MMTSASDQLESLLCAMYGESRNEGQIDFVGDGFVPSAFAATDFAAASLGTAGLALTRLLNTIGHSPRVKVDRQLTSAWFSSSLRPQGWEAPPAWDSLSGDYQTKDGWIRLHANAPHHSNAALKVLGCLPERLCVSQAVLTWEGDVLEETISLAGGCAAAMRSVEQWLDHPQGKALASEPLMFAATTQTAPNHGWQPRAERPLQGVRVLDLTRVLAGPVATRFLAGYGAQVLRIDPPNWNESLIPEVTLGKRCARLDAKSSTGIRTLRHLLADTDILVHGYRPGALESLGLSATERQAVRPGLIDISLDAYGWTGPWRARRGFDSLVQMSTGIAERGRSWAGSNSPTPLPFQALDHATGYLMAAAALNGLEHRMQNGQGYTARFSLARTAKHLIDHASHSLGDRPMDLQKVSVSGEIEHTSWGPAKRVNVPLIIEGTPMWWHSPAVHLGSSPPLWS